MNRKLQAEIDSHIDNPLRLLKGGRVEMKKWSRIIFTTFIILLSVSGCKSAEPIKIGFAGDLTGNNSAVAVSGRDAVQIAIDEINQKGGLMGRQVVLISKDDQSNFEETKRVDKAFIDEGVPIVVGHMMSGVAPAMMKAIKDQNILMIAPTISAHYLSDIDDNFMRTTLTNRDQGSFLATHIYNNAHKKRLMVLYSNTNKTFIEGMKPAVTDTFSSLGGEIVYEAVIREKNTPDMESAVSEGLKHQADAVVLLMNAGDVAMFSQVALKERAPFSIYSGTWGMTAEVIRMGGKAVEGVVFPSQFDPTSTNQRYLEFSKTYQERYEQIPDFGAIYSYDTAQVIFKGIAKANTTDPMKVKKAIIEIKTFEGLQQNFEINAYGDTICDHFMFMIKNGEFVNIEDLK